MAHPNALLSSESEDHGTPSAYVEIARYTLGSIDLDPASSSYWNHHVVKAATVYDEQVDMLAARTHLFGHVLLNPPSRAKKKDDPRPAISVRPFWEKLADYWTRGEVEAAVYVVFSLNQLTMLQSSPMHPAMFPMMLPRERGRFLQRGTNNGPPVPGEQPTHGNALVLLPSKNSTVARGQMARFEERSRDLECGGCLVRPW